MALIDEGKLQGNIMNILEVLRKQQACCGFISAQWMLDANGDNVWVLVRPGGDVVVKTSPTGAVEANPALPLQPPTSGGGTGGPVLNQKFTGNNTPGPFSIPANKHLVEVTVDGLGQDPTTDFSFVTGTGAVTFLTGSPSTGGIIIVYYQ